MIVEPMYDLAVVSTSVPGPVWPVPPYPVTVSSRVSVFGLKML